MIFHNLFPAWWAGIAYATLAVAALIPAAIMSISAANLFTRSIYSEYFRPRATAAEEARVGRWASLLREVRRGRVHPLAQPRLLHRASSSSAASSSCRRCRRSSSAC